MNAGVVSLVVVVVVVVEEVRLLRKVVVVLVVVGVDVVVEDVGVVVTGIDLLLIPACAVGISNDVDAGVGVVVTGGLITPAGVLDVSTGMVVTG